ncbi:MAG TPA: hemolysin family protein [Rhodanobacteraceae bacterium]|jgi:putative hemolysin|nr:hemolysin family protein [Rhodanobacteraceae bacterium]
MLIDLGLVLLLALGNAFFALTEIALIAARKSRLRYLARTSARAQVALRLAQRPDRFLSTVQVGITIITLVTGAATGTAIGDSIRRWVITLGLPVSQHAALALGLVLGFLLVTIINITVGELAPKRAALVAPERIAQAVAFPMQAMSWLLAPFVWLLDVITDGLLHLLRLHHFSREKVSEEEIRLLVNEGAEQGVLDSDERNMVYRVLRLGDRSVDSVMTPRPRIAWLDATAPLAENLAVMRTTPYSRYPVYRGSEDEVLGVLEVKRLLQSVAADPSQGSTPARLDLFRKLARPLFVPATTRALDLLDEFRDAESPFALVVDEYGDIEGLVTLNDVLTAVVGHPTGDHEGGPVGETMAVHREDGSWLVSGSMATDDLRELLALDELPNEQDGDYYTLAGMLIELFAHIPAEGESTTWRGFRFEVVDLDGARIDKVLITPPVVVNDASDAIEEDGG